MTRDSNARAPREEAKEEPGFRVKILKPIQGRAWAEEQSTKGQGKGWLFRDYGLHILRVFSSKTWSD